MRAYVRVCVNVDACVWIACAYVYMKQSLVYTFYLIPIEIHLLPVFCLRECMVAAVCCEGVC